VRAWSGRQQRSVSEWRRRRERVDRVGVVLQSLQGHAGLSRRLAEARAIERWPEIVGSHLAERTRPLRVADGRLFVLAAGAALRQELTFHTRTIVRKFNAAAQARIVREVKFLESDSLEGSGTQPPSAAVARAEWGDEEERREAQEEETTDGVEDEGEEGEVESSEPDVGAMYEPFDAEAYRRQLETIRNGTSERQEP